MNIVKFKSLHLENFKGFKMADVNFGEKATMIIGSNGIGKTTRNRNHVVLSVSIMIW